MIAIETQADRRYAKLRFWAIFISYTSITVQGIIGLVALSVKRESAGVLGFGLQTISDISTTFVVLWRFHGSDGGFSKKRETRSVFALASLLVVLSLGVAIEAIYDIVNQSKPSEEYLLMTICGVGLCVYTFFAWIKMTLGEKIKSKAVFLDGLSTTASAGLAGSLLFSIIIYKVSNMWYLDNVIAIIFAIAMITYSSSVIYKDIYKPYKMRSSYTELPGETKPEIDSNVEYCQVFYV